ncbi:T9SS type A sorting domain-containing protein [Mariniflexile maritimum]|uniref:T9SS type A sorting domain-containing protein n=1 Tax=Mariniflexile maritimum TaxID=2682493 RepID=UPI0012F665F6|nr:T9SS type A sorting domain-containing protein [Mariniflexile maritimum]
MGHNISIFGDATPGGWNTDTDMVTSDNVNYSINSVPLIAGNLKFRGNHSWDLPYNWGGTAFPSGTAIVNADGIVVPTSGTYNITFNINTGAYAFSATLGINDVKNIHFKVYPNPSRSGWNIQSENIMTSVEVYNVIGKHIMSLKRASNFIFIENDALQKGIYFAQITSHSGISSLKLVKE